MRHSRPVSVYGVNSSGNPVIIIPAPFINPIRWLSPAATMIAATFVIFIFMNLLSDYKAKMCLYPNL